MWPCRVNYHYGLILAVEGEADTSHSEEKEYKFTTVEEASVSCELYP